VSITEVTMQVEPAFHVQIGIAPAFCWCMYVPPLANERFCHPPILPAFLTVPVTERGISTVTESGDWMVTTSPPAGTPGAGFTQDNPSNLSHVLTSLQFPEACER